MIIGYQYSRNFNENRCAKISFERSLRASSPIWASEASLARTRERAAKPRGAPSLARSREAHFAYPNRRACSQATLSERILLLTVSLIDILAYYCVLTKNTKICISISGLHFSTVPNTGFICCHSSLDQLFVYKIKLNLFFLLFFD